MPIVNAIVEFVVTYRVFTLWTLISVVLAAFVCIRFGLVRRVKRLWTEL